MHRANFYIRQNIIIGDPPATQPTTISINQTQANKLRQELQADGVSYLYSSLISLIDAMNGLNNKFYSWPTVKLYYSSFYSLRAAMAFDDLCIFYVGKKPFSIKANDNETPKKETGNTHKCIIDIFKRHAPTSSFNTQQIDLQDPLVWLSALREQANYKNPKHYEPSTPMHFEKMEQNGLSNSIDAYVKDIDNIYTFDKDHASIALPIQLILYASGKMKNSGNNYSLDDITYLKSAINTTDSKLLDLLN